MAKLPHTSSTAGAQALLQAVRYYFFSNESVSAFGTAFLSFLCLFEKTGVFLARQLSKIILSSLKITETYPFYRGEKTISSC